VSLLQFTRVYATRNVTLGIKPAGYMPIGLQIAALVSIFGLKWALFANWAIPPLELGNSSFDMYFCAMCGIERYIVPQPQVDMRPTTTLLRYSLKSG